MTIITPNKVDQVHLDAVKAEMLTHGAPTIRAIGNGEIYWAIEGSHRLVAAYEMGLEPEIEEVEYSNEMITIQWDGYDEELVISELANMLFDNRSNHTLGFN